jgi:hypothetical protein
MTSLPGQGKPLVPVATPEQVSAMRQKQAEVQKSQKTFAASLHEMLEQQKQATNERVTAIMSNNLKEQKEHTRELHLIKTTSAEQQTHQMLEKKLNPYLHKNLVVEHQQKMREAQVSSKSAFSAQFELTQNKLIAEQVVKENYNRQAGKLKVKADKLASQMTATTSDRVKSVTRAINKTKSQGVGGLIII